MRLWGWRRRNDAGDEEYPEPLDVSAVWDEQLSAHLDGELDEHEAAVIEDALAADPALEVRLGEFAAVRDALGSLGEVRAPRPFTLEAPATGARRAPGRLELVFRMGAVAAAVAFAIVLTGDIAGLGGEGVEGWGISRPSFGGGESEQASEAPQAAPAQAAAAPTAAPATPAATQAAATQAATTAPTAQPTAAAEAAEAAATPQPTVAALAAATAEATPTATAVDAPALPTVTTETRAAARSVEPDEDAEAPAADATPAPTAGASGASAEEATPATPEAAAAAEDTDEAGDATEAAAPAATAEAAPAATATPAPSIADESVQIEAQDGDDSARALRRAEQGLLVTALALAGLTLLLGLWRRRGGAV